MKFIYLGLCIMLINFSCSNDSVKDDKSNKDDSTGSVLNTNSQAASNFNLSLEDFGKYLFGCVQKNDYLLYSKYIPSKVELVDLLKKSDKLKKVAANDQEIENGYKQTLADIKKAFDQTVSEGISKGIIWNEANYIKTAYNSSNENGFEFSKITVSFSYKGLTYSLEFNENIKTSRGWLTVSKAAFEKAIEEDDRPAIDTSAPAQNN